jgi:predicted esterase
VAIEEAHLAGKQAASRGPRWLFALALLAASVLPAPRAAAQGLPDASRAPGSHRDWPCPGCIMVVPPSYSPSRPAPLMVALHGDGASTDLVVRMWKEPLERRGYLLVALRCPRELGCENSFWRWHGDPAWITAKLDAVEAAYSVDPARIYLSGWSGGSTYMGLSAPLLSQRFAAINLNGGGVPPPSGECGSCKPPVYYFVGSKNPMISLVKSTADYFKRCGHEVVWDLGAEMDHPAELQAIFAGPVAERVVSWLDTKRNTCLGAPASAPGNAGAEGGAKGVDGDPAAGALLATADNAIELTANTTVQGAAAPDEPAFGAAEPTSIPPGRAASKSGPVPGGCGCRPGAAASAEGPSGPAGSLQIAAGSLGKGPLGSAWLMIAAAALFRARRRSHRSVEVISNDRRRAP